MFKSDWADDTLLVEEEGHTWLCRWLAHSRSRGSSLHQPKRPTLLQGRALRCSSASDDLHLQNSRLALCPESRLGPSDGGRLTTGGPAQSRHGLVCIGSRPAVVLHAAAHAARQLHRPVLPRSACALLEKLHNARRGPGPCCGWRGPAWCHLQPFAAGAHLVLVLPSAAGACHLASACRPFQAQVLPSEALDYIHRGTDGEDV